MSGDRGPERDAGRAAAELGQPEGAGKVPDRPVGEPSGPGSAVQAGGALPGEAGPPDGTPGEAMLAPTMPGEDPGVA